MGCLPLLKNHVSDLVLMFVFCFPHFLNPQVACIKLALHMNSFWLLHDVYLLIYFFAFLVLQVDSSLVRFIKGKG